MRNVNIVIMGKTGAGKSTLVNAIMAADVAPTGIGQPITKKNQTYSRSMMISRDSCDNFQRVNSTINLYDTVGLELSSSMTKETLAEIQGYIEKAQNKASDMDINLVWFCVNHRCKRFENYEVELIKELANNYEIPFVIVITQCFSNKKGELERQIENDLPEVSIKRILAKDYETDAGVLYSFGINELLFLSVFDYKKLKVSILESKLERLIYWREERISEIENRANRCIEKHANSAMKIGFLPGGCIPFVHGICIKMLYDLDKIVGIHTIKGFEEDIFSNVIVGIIATPFMVIPLLSAAVAYGYVQSIGESYLEVLLAVIEKSSDLELADIELMSLRIKEELRKRS